MDEKYLAGMERLVSVVQELSRARTLPMVQEIVRQAARELTGADGATFVLRDEDRCFYADEDAIEPLWKGQRFPMSACISGWAMLNGRTAIIEDIYADSRIPADAYRRTFVKSLVMVPVRTESPIAAIGNYWAVCRVPTDTEVRLLQALANSTAVALENVALLSQLEERIRERTVAVEAAIRAEKQARRELEERERAEAALRRTEGQLRQVQKMDAIGHLAGGVAHDFNNILSVILSFSEMAMEDLDPASPLRSDLEEVHKAGERAAALTKRLLAFSRQQAIAPKLIDVGHVARDMELMLKRLIGEHMQLEMRLSSGLHPVFADGGQLEQVLMNLVVNARDAMPDGGKLTVEASNVHLGGEYTSELLGMTEGHYVMLAVSDTGIGMDRATQARLFEPFFTTKEKGKGTGLGLSTVYGIIKQSGGHIWVYSEPGQGTTFKVYLPRAEDAPSMLEPEAAPAVRLDGTETVLVVEDDEQVRKLVIGVLERSGYSVFEASSADRAIEIASTTSVQIDLLITDMIMPEMSGAELIAQLAGIRPALRVICTSGYTGQATLRRGTLQPGIAFVEKPLTPDALLTSVRRVLDTSRS